MFGKIKLVNFDRLNKMPQDVATAWEAATDDLIGVEYKPLLYLGEQLVNGINYWLIAEQKLLTYPVVRRIVLLAINVNDNDVGIVDDSIVEIL